MSKIINVECHKVLDSRGEWTLATTVTLENKVFATAHIPKGASTGENESHYLPVDKAVRIVSTLIKDAISGQSVYDQQIIDEMLIKIDGTPNKKHLGGNSCISVSLAVAKAAAKCKNIQLYNYISNLYGSQLSKKLKFPTPLFNILNGGKHANNNLSFQEFVVIPNPTLNYYKQVQTGMTVYANLKSLLIKDGYNTGVGDEGGFAPFNFNVEKAFKYIKKAVEINFELGKDVFLGIDVAAGSFYDGENYEIREQKNTLTNTMLLSFYKSLVKKYPLIYVEDPFYENDTIGWSNFYSVFNNKLMVVADDLVVTNTKYLSNAIKNNLANAVIVKPNQVGTLSETLDFIKMAKNNNMSTIISHRSGDTPEDTFIADLAIGTKADFIKSGSPVRGERVAKYNRLLEIYYEESK